jgi:hypothetical protein
MKKITTIIATILFSLLSLNLANAGSFGLGVTGNIASVSASGSETAGDTAGSETDTSVTSATAGNKFAFGSVFAEYSFGDSERFTLGVDYIPGSADINSKTLSRTDADQAGATAIDTGTLKANATIKDHYTIYGELMIAGGVYAKYGFSQVDIDVKQTNSSGYGTYPDKTLDAHTLGLGYKGTYGTNGFFKIEGFYSDYDSYKGTSSSTNAHTVSADLDVVGAKLALGYKF